jgi:molybdopterin molybdotransferase
MGAFDTVKEVLGASGEVEFCRVAMQPGMPQGAGHLRPQGTQIITLPGNPVSSFVSFEMFVRPVLRRMQGYVDVFRPDETAVAAESFDSVANKQQFQRAQITTGPDGVRFARPLGAQGSHFLGGLAMSTGLIVVPRDVMRVEVGETVAIIDWRWLTS